VGFEEGEVVVEVDVAGRGWTSVHFLINPIRYWIHCRDRHDGSSVRHHA